MSILLIGIQELFVSNGVINMVLSTVTVWWFDNTSVPVGIGYHYLLNWL